ncbi:MAG TPA: hypothetical protein VKM36_00175, partial [Balneolaceae bacterium]|nr:hypothetical protein [Balneolaceae bacterium]
MTRNVISTLIIMLFLGLPLLAQAQPEQMLTDDFIQPGESKTLTSDTVWILDGFVFVEDGSELFIEPGTVIKG